MSATEDGTNLLEKIAFGFVFAVSLTVALAYSPLWTHLPDFTALFPARYAEVIGALPGTPNTGLAFLVTLALTYGALFLFRDPTAALGAIAAVTLGTAAYPYGKVLWHRLFLETPLDAARPTIGAWIRALIPVLLLLVPPVVTHIRGMRAAYRRKKADQAEVDRLTKHLVQNGLTLGGIALLISIGLGLLVTLGARIVATENRFLGRNSALVMLLVGLLVVFALGIGTGLFGKKEDNTAEPTPGKEKA